MACLRTESADSEFDDLKEKEVEVDNAHASEEVGEDDVFEDSQEYMDGDNEDQDWEGNVSTEDSEGMSQSQSQGGYDCS